MTVRELIGKLVMFDGKMDVVALWEGGFSDLMEPTVEDEKGIKVVCFDVDDWGSYHFRLDSAKPRS